MLNKSVSYDNVKNQPKSSWKDDPFDLKGSFAGVANLIPKKSLETFCKQLAHDYGKSINGEYQLDIEFIPQDELLELSSLYIESTGRELTECVNGNDFSIDNDYSCALILMLKDDCEQNRDNFAKTVQKNIIQYYKPQLEDLLTSSCHEFICMQMNSQGYHSSVDPDHGDVIWGRF